MRFDVVTLFPELFAPFIATGITRRAFASGAVALHTWALRDFTEDTYRRVDDRPYGGGPGMVMMAEPLSRAVRAAQQARVEEGTERGPVVLFSPAGRRLSQARIQAFARSPGAILVCGRYEGVDQRFVDACVDEEISLGDFVLSGGELPALVLLDAVARLQDGVLTDPASHQQDSFSDGLLDCPHYSRPEQWEGRGVPGELMSGHHARIARWRRERQLEATFLRRPDLIDQARGAGRLTDADERFLRSLSGQL